MDRFGQKFWLGVIFLIFSFSLAETAVLTGVKGWDAAGVTGLIAAMAAGLLSVVQANVAAKKVTNGPRNP